MNQPDGRCVRACASRRRSPGGASKLRRARNGPVSDAGGQVTSCARCRWRGRRRRRSSSRQARHSMKRTRTANGRFSSSRRRVQTGRSSRTTQRACAKAQARRGSGGCSWRQARGSPCGAGAGAALLGAEVGQRDRHETEVVEGDVAGVEVGSESEVAAGSGAGRQELVAPESGVAGNAREHAHGADAGE